MRPDKSLQINNDSTTLLGIRHQLVDRLMQGAFYLAIIGAPISISRALFTGWIGVYNLHCVLAIVTIGLYLVKHKTPFFIKRIFIIYSFVLVGTVGSISYGLLGPGIWMLVMSTMLFSILYSKRSGLISMVLIIIYVAVIGYCFINGILRYPVDANEYMISPASWLIFMVAATYVPIAIFQTFTSFQFEIISLFNEIKSQQSYIKNLENKGQLTGLSNSKDIQKQVQVAIDTAKEMSTNVALFYIELVGYNRVSEVIGQDAGDQIAAVIAKRLSSFNQENNIVACTGKNQFIMIVNDFNNIESLELIAKNIILKIEKSIKYKGGSFLIKSKIGIGTFPDQAASAASLIYTAQEVINSMDTTEESQYSIFNKLKI